METILPTPPDGRVMRLVRSAARLDRAQLETVVESLIAALDARDGDIDLEDSETGDTRVDDRGRRLGCYQLSDCRLEDDADSGDRAWIEWDTREPGEQRVATFEPMGDGYGEDDEPSGDEMDGSWCSEDEFQHLHDTGPGCDLTDPGGGTERDDDEPGNVELFDLHRDRIRATMCDLSRRWGSAFYQLRSINPAGARVSL